MTIWVGGLFSHSFWIWANIFFVHPPLSIFLSLSFSPSLTFSIFQFSLYLCAVFQPLKNCEIPSQTWWPKVDSLNSFICTHLRFDNVFRQESSTVVKVPSSFQENSIKFSATKERALKSIAHDQSQFRFGQHEMILNVRKRIQTHTQTHTHTNFEKSIDIIWSSNPIIDNMKIEWKTHNEYRVIKVYRTQNAIEFH